MTRTEFERVMGGVTSAWANKDYSAALDGLEVIVRNGSREMIADALFFRGMIQTERGAIEQSRHDWLEALSLANEGTFLHYSLEAYLGKSFEDEDKSVSALEWYWKSIRSCAYGDEFSCELALAAILGLTSGEIVNGDRKDFEEALIKSWRVVGVTGDPDLAHLSESVERLREYLVSVVDKIAGDATDSIS